MTADLYIVGGDIDAPTDAAANQRFHQAILGRLVEQARERGWQGGRICGYDRFDGRVACNLAPSDSGWPDLEALRAFREANRDAEPLLSRPDMTVSPDEYGQGSMF